MTAQTHSVAPAGHHGPAEASRALLVVDDDDIFRERLCRAMERRGFRAFGAASVEEAQSLARGGAVDYAVIDLKLGSTSGLDLVPMLRGAHPSCRVVMLTGYGNIATAVAAIKAGAVDYLAKPADADDIEAALLARKAEKPAPPAHPMSADRVRWEHIQRIYELCDRNVSETARRLNMHRRTLQRILAKHSPR
ncbi:MAG TPA: ActR/PrrA/RegA family redox response regulator transcription factor [Alphaproteobacteria bacterium]|nr:ActR/PrrA/RegA family redox response regulator transcription factor [Alphaproteobacteria bacterium]